MPRKKQLGRVKVVYRSDRDAFVLRWVDPHTGDRRQKTSEAASRRDAEREALRLEDEIQTGELLVSGTRKGHTTWEEFTDRYERDHLSRGSAANKRKWTRMSSLIVAEFAERRIRNGKLGHITPELLAAVEVRYLGEGARPNTVASGMATLRAGLSWAAEIGLVDPIVAPKKRRRIEEIDKEMRGRAITGEELDRFVAAVEIHEQIVEKHWQGWKDLINGLYLSGLRVGEAFWLHDSRRDCHRPVNLDGKEPGIAFVSRQKNRRDQVVAITPDFAAFLREIRRPDDWYFHPCGLRGRRKTSESVGQIISEIGTLARIVTNADDPENIQFASAHDLRRSFAQRCAARVMPNELMHLMRHTDIKMTLKFYVGSCATAASRAIHDAWARSQPDQSNPETGDQTGDQAKSESA